MNVAKRDYLLNSLLTSIHTMQMICSDMDVDEAKKDYHLREINKLSDDRIRFILNVNKGILNGSGLFDSYDETRSMIDFVLYNSDVKDEYLTRVDICLNTFESGDFNLYKKYFRMLLCCVAYTENLKNTYQTQTLWEFADLNIAVKNNSIEAENYNKELESDGIVPTTNRLELRSKGLKSSDLTIDETIFEVVDRWHSILDRASTKEVFEATQNKYNHGLMKKYKELFDDNKIVSITSFVVCYSNAIFTHKQLVSLLEMLGVENAENKARKIKQRYKIEFFSYRDLTMLVDGIKKSINNYIVN